MTSVPLKPHRGKAVYCVVRNVDGEVMGMYRERREATASCLDGMRVETYVQKPGPRR